MNELAITGVSFDYTLEPSKKQIIQRLFEEGHITFNEMWTLLLEEPNTKYIVIPPPNTNPIVTPWITSTSDDNNNR